MSKLTTWNGLSAVERRVVQVGVLSRDTSFELYFTGPLTVVALERLIEKIQVDIETIQDESPKKSKHPEGR